MRVVSIVSTCALLVLVACAAKSNSGNGTRPTDTGTSTSTSGAEVNEKAVGATGTSTGTSTSGAEVNEKAVGATGTSTGTSTSTSTSGAEVSEKAVGATSTSTSTGTSASASEAEVSKKAVGAFTEIDSALTGVKDGESAKAAAPKLTSLTEKLGPIMAQVKSLGAAPVEKAGGEGKDVGGLGTIGKDLAGKAQSMLSGPLKDVMAKVTAEIERITKIPALNEPLKGVLGKLQSLMKIS